jgi:hypothetical protein
MYVKIGMLASAAKCRLKRHAKLGVNTDDQPLEESCCDAVINERFGPLRNGIMPAGPSSFVVAEAVVLPATWMSGLAGLACASDKAAGTHRTSRTNELRTQDKKRLRTRGARWKKGLDNSVPSFKRKCPHKVPVVAKEVPQRNSRGLNAKKG